MPDKNDVEIYVEIDATTRWPNGKPKAYHCFDGINKFWLPASQVEVEPVKGCDYKVIMPERLAKEKGVI